MSTICQRFHANPKINPESGRTISIGGPVYNRLSRLCGHPSFFQSIQPLVIDINSGIQEYNRQVDDFINRLQNMDFGTPVAVIPQ